MNQIALIGALTKEPETVRGGDQPICRLRLVEANGHPDHPLYINACAYGAQAAACVEHLAKGRRVAVSGRLRYRQWQRVDRSRHSEYFLAADRVEFLDRPARPAAEAEPRATAEPAGAAP